MDKLPRMTLLSYIIVFCGFLICRSDSFLDSHQNNYYSYSKGLLNSANVMNRNEFTKNRFSRSTPVMLAQAPSSAVTMASIKAVLKLLSTCGIGVAASKAGILDKATLKVLSKLVYDVFQPCLLFTNVATTIAKASASRDASILILPAVACFQVLLGYVLGKLLSIVFYPGVKNCDDKKQLLACTTFSNSAPLPLVFTDSLFRNHPDQTINSRCIAYISMYLLTWSPLFWAVGGTILSGDSSNLSKQEKRKQLLSRVFGPPMIGCLTGLIVGSVPFLRNLISSPTGLLNPIFEAMKTLAAAYLPAVLLVLSGSLLPTTEIDPDPDRIDNAAEIDKPKNDQFEFIKKLAAVYSARFIFMPIVGFTCIRAVKKYLPFGAKLLADPVLVFILLLESCMPSAQNSTVILQLQGNRTAAASMARTLVAMYTLGVPAISFWLAKILSETKILG